MVKVNIDDREKKTIQRVLDYFEQERDKFKNIDLLEIAHLASGDIGTSDLYVGVERKSSSDFIGSMCSGKLKQQLFELKQNFKQAYLLVEDYNGIIDCIEANPNIHPNTIIGTVASTFAHSNVPILFVGDFYVPIVLNIIEKFYDGREYTERDYTPIRTTASKKDFQRYIIKGLPNVGVLETERILKHFNNSISKLVNASEEEIQQIKGIGKETAKAIKEVLS